MTTSANALEAMRTELKTTMEAMVLQSAVVEKEDYLNSLVKSQECNIKVHGVHYRVKDFQRKNAKARNEWRADMIRRILVDTHVVEEEVLFENRNGKKTLRDVVRDMHPLSQKDKNTVVGPTIVIAFTQSMLANDIKEVVRKDAGLQLTKQKRGREAEVIRITSHLPPILEALRNECLRERRSLISASGGTTRYICDESLRWPWISLVKVDGDKKIPLSFKVEDPRLADPARALAYDHLHGIRKFTPHFVLNADQKKALGPPKMTFLSKPEANNGNNVDMA